jgi:hypothetical protein
MDNFVQLSRKSKDPSKRNSRRSSILKKRQPLVNINEEIKDGFPQPSKRRVSFNRHIGVKEYHPTDATGEVTFSDQVHFPVPDVPKTVKNQEDTYSSVVQNTADPQSANVQDVIASTPLYQFKHHPRMSTAFNRLSIIPADSNTNAESFTSSLLLEGDMDLPQEEPTKNNVSLKKGHPSADPSTQDMELTCSYIHHRDQDGIEGEDFSVYEDHSSQTVMQPVNTETHQPLSTTANTAVDMSLDLSCAGSPIVLNNLHSTKSLQANLPGEKKFEEKKDSSDVSLTCLSPGLDSCMSFTCTSPLQKLPSQPETSTASQLPIPPPQPDTPSASQPIPPPQPETSTASQLPNPPPQPEASTASALPKPTSTVTILEEFPSEPETDTPGPLQKLLSQHKPSSHSPGEKHCPQSYEASIDTDMSLTCTNNQSISGSKVQVNDDMSRSVKGANNPQQGCSNAEDTCKISAVMPLPCHDKSLSQSYSIWTTDSRENSIVVGEDKEKGRKDTEFSSDLATDLSTLPPLTVSVVDKESTVSSKRAHSPQEGQGGPVTTKPPMKTAIPRLGMTRKANSRMKQTRQQRRLVLPHSLSSSKLSSLVHNSLTASVLQNSLHMATTKDFSTGSETKIVESASVPSNDESIKGSEIQQMLSVSRSQEQMFTDSEEKHIPRDERGFGQGKHTSLQQERGAQNRVEVEGQNRKENIIQSQAEEISHNQADEGSHKQMDGSQNQEEEGSQFEEIQVSHHCKEQGAKCQEEQGREHPSEQGRRYPEEQVAECSKEQDHWGQIERESQNQGEHLKQSPVAPAVQIQEEKTSQYKENQAPLFQKEDLDMEEHDHAITPFADSIIQGQGQNSSLKLSTDASITPIVIKDMGIDPLSDSVSLQDDYEPVSMTFTGDLPDDVPSISVTVSLPAEESTVSKNPRCSLNGTYVVSPDSSKVVSGPVNNPSSIPHCLKEEPGESLAPNVCFEEDGFDLLSKRNEFMQQNEISLVGSSTCWEGDSSRLEEVETTHEKMDSTDAQYQSESDVTKLSPVHPGEVPKLDDVTVTGSSKTSSMLQAEGPTCDEAATRVLTTDTYSNLTPQLCPDTSSRQHRSNRSSTKRKTRRSRLSKSFNTPSGASRQKSLLSTPGSEFPSFVLTPNTTTALLDESKGHDEDVFELYLHLTMSTAPEYFDIDRSEFQRLTASECLSRLITLYQEVSTVLAVEESQPVTDSRKKCFLWHILEFAMYGLQRLYPLMKYEEKFCGQPFPSALEDKMDHLTAPCDVPEESNAFICRWILRKSTEVRLLTPRVDSLVKGTQKRYKWRLYRWSKHKLCLYFFTPVVGVTLNLTPAKGLDVIKAKVELQIPNGPGDDTAREFCTIEPCDMELQSSLPIVICQVLLDMASKHKLAMASL